MDQKLIIKADRAAAWILFVVIIAYGITGYGMTRGFISADISRQLHLELLGGVGLLAFIIHTSWAIHLFFIRHGIWNQSARIILFLFYISLTGLFVWLQFFFNPPTEQGSRSNNAQTAQSVAGNTNSSGDNTIVRHPRHRRWLDKLGRLKGDLSGLSFLLIN